MLKLEGSTTTGQHFPDLPLPQDLGELPAFGLLAKLISTMLTWSPETLVSGMECVSQRSCIAFYLVGITLGIRLGEHFNNKKTLDR